MASSTLRPRSKRRKVATSDEESGVSQRDQRPKKHWIACLFTSVGYGKPTKTHSGMDKPEEILQNTRKALIDLKEQLVKLEMKGEKRYEEDSLHARPKTADDAPRELWSCRFNSGLFAVEWADTKKVLEEELKGLGKSVQVVSPESN